MPLITQPALHYNKHIWSPSAQQSSICHHCEPPPLPATSPLNLHPNPSGSQADQIMWLSHRSNTPKSPIVTQLLHLINTLPPATHGQQHTLQHTSAWPPDPALVMVHWFTTATEMIMSLQKLSPIMIQWPLFWYTIHEENQDYAT